MRNLFLCILAFTCLTAVSQPQEPDSEELEKRNGFKSIRLNFPVDSIKGAEFKEDIFEKGGFQAKLYQVTGEEFKNIGSIKIEKVRVKAYKDLVYEIVVITEKNPDLMKGLSKALGKPSFSVRTNIYSWRSKSVALTFEPSGKNDLKLTYKSYPVFRLMAEDKGRKVEDVINDF